MSLRNLQATGETEHEARQELLVRVGLSEQWFGLRLSSDIFTQQVNGTWYARCRVCPTALDQYLDNTLDIVYNEEEQKQAELNAKEI